MEIKRPFPGPVALALLRWRETGGVRSGRSRAALQTTLPG